MSITIALKRLPFMAGNPAKPNARVSFILNNNPRSYLMASAQGQRLLELLRAPVQDLEAIAEIAEVQLWIAKRSHGRVTVDECERLRLDGELINYGLTGRVSQIVEQGASFEALANFIERASRNPNRDVAEHLYSFLEKGDSPFNEDGMIVLFKRVNSDGRSFTRGNEDVTVRYADGREEVVRGNIPHPVGGEIWMDRALCNENRNQTCSVGLHGCSFEYLNKYHGGQGLIRICLVDPADVTAIPTDVNESKLRTCRLQIVGEVAEADAKNHFKSAVDLRYPALKPVVESDAVLADIAAAVDEFEANAAHADDDELLLTDRVEDDLTDRVISEQADPPEPETLVADRTPADWAKQGYEDGAQAGGDDHSNGYDYEPQFSLPAEIIDDAARSAYAKAFVEGYDAKFRELEADTEVDLDAIEPEAD